MNKSDYFEEWSKLHGGAEIKGIVGAWLTISYLLCRPLLLLKISPNFLTFSALFFAAGYLYKIQSIWAIVLLTITLALDGIDGTLAILRGKVSRFGAVLDAVIDRAVESLWIYGLFLLGAPWQILTLIWLVSFIQEYMRARAGGLGESGIGIVTVSERPVRASIIFIALVFYHLDLNLISQMATFWAALQLASAIQLFISLRLRLQQSPR